MRGEHVREEHLPSKAEWKGSAEMVSGVAGHSLLSINPSSWGDSLTKMISGDNKEV